MQKMISSRRNRGKKLWNGHYYINVCGSRPPTTRDDHQFRIECMTRFWNFQNHSIFVKLHPEHQRKILLMPRRWSSFRHIAYMFRSAGTPCKICNAAIVRTIGCKITCLELLSEKIKWTWNEWKWTWQNLHQNRQAKIAQVTKPFEV